MNPSAVDCVVATKISYGSIRAIADSNILAYNNSNGENKSVGETYVRVISTHSGERSSRNKSSFGARYRIWYLSSASKPSIIFSIVRLTGTITISTANGMGGGDTPRISDRGRGTGNSSIAATPGVINTTAKHIRTKSQNTNERPRDKNFITPSNTKRNYLAPCRLLPLFSHTNKKPPITVYKLSFNTNRCTWKWLGIVITLCKLSRTDS